MIIATGFLLFFKFVNYFKKEYTVSTLFYREIVLLPKRYIMKVYLKAFLYLLSFCVVMKNYTVDDFSDALLTEELLNNQLNLDDAYLQAFLQQDEPVFAVEEAVPAVSKVMVPPALIVSMLEAVNLKKILMQDFFLKTYQLEVKGIHDYPLFHSYKDPFKLCRKTGRKKSISVVPFFTYVSPSLFESKEEDTLQAYLALNETRLLTALHDSITQLKQFSDQFYFDVAAVFNSLSHTYIQQRKLGALLSSQFLVGESLFGVSVPFLYSERNFQMPQYFKDVLEREFGASTAEQQEAFKKHHLIADKVGCGDLKVQCAHKFRLKPYYEVQLQLASVLPTAFAIKSGMLGTTFKSKSALPAFHFADFAELLITNNQEKIFQLTTDLAYDCLDRIAYALLEHRLGEGRFAVSAGISQKVNIGKFLSKAWLKRFRLESSFFIEYKAPMTVKQSFATKINRSALENSTMSSDPAKLLDLFSQGVVSQLFLRSFCAQVSGSVALKYRSALVYHAKQYRVFVGSDSWLKSPTYINVIKAPSDIKNTLDKQKADKKYAAQAILFGGATYSMKRSAYSVDFNIAGYTSTLSRGIGKDIGFSVGCDISF